MVPQPWLDSPLFVTSLSLTYSITNADSLPQMFEALKEAMNWTDDSSAAAVTAIVETLQGEDYKFQNLKELMGYVKDLDNIWTDVTQGSGLDQLMKAKSWVRTRLQGLLFYRVHCMNGNPFFFPQCYVLPKFAPTYHPKILNQHDDCPLSLPFSVLLTLPPVRTLVAGDGICIACIYISVSQLPHTHTHTHIHTHTSFLELVHASAVSAPCLPPFVDQLLPRGRYYSLL